MGGNSRPTPRSLPICTEKKVFVPLRTLKSAQLKNPNGQGIAATSFIFYIIYYGKI